MKYLLFSLSLLLPFSILHAQEQRALLIGINHYAPPKGTAASDDRPDYPDLEGSRNDALAVYSLISSKFGFAEKNIDTLMEDKATRKGILSAMDKLLKKSKAGDVAFLYYAGHGSQMRNSLSFEADKMDQTIVPSNAWMEGVSDIRDKELSRIFNAFLDKKVKLTVIFDCCHSGSISRGPNTITGKFRYMPMSTADSKDASRSEIPENRSGDNFLIFSAAQSDELAAEQSDDNDMPHGAFTLAFISALNQQSVDASAISIFTAARAILKSNGKKQEPVIGGSLQRQQQTLFGLSKGKLADYSYVPVIKMLGKQVKLQGGVALGLLKENELCMINGKDTLFQLRIDTVTGINSSIASVIKGDPVNIKPGFLFRVTNWVSSKRPLLKVYVPKSGMTDEEVMKFTSLASELKRSAKIKWFASFNKGNGEPYTSVFWQGGRCFIKSDLAAATEIKNPSAESILALCKKDSTLYVELPVSDANAEKYARSIAENRGIQLVNDPGSAQYVLFGNLSPNSLPAYGFRKTEISVKDSLESMPLQTNCYELAAGVNTTDSLNTAALKLAKLRGWLTLMTPDATKKGFGYQMELYNETEKRVITDGRYRIGDNVTMKLVADADLASQFPTTKYVYIFAIDQSGAMKLIFPDAGNVNTKFPIYANGNLLNEVTLLSYTIGIPSGTDNYFVLACDENISNAGMVFNQEGVYTSSARDGSSQNQLSDLLDMGNAGSRSPGPKKSNWSVQRYTFRCVY